eukprot:8244059-Lingulodinium_polyedra.AAC.1
MKEHGAFISPEIFKAASDAKDSAILCVSLTYCLFVLKNTIMHEKNVHVRVKRIAELRKQMKLKGIAIHDVIEQQLQACATP